MQTCFQAGIINTRPVNKHTFRNIFRRAQRRTFIQLFRNLQRFQNYLNFILLTLNKSVLIKFQNDHIFQHNGLLMLIKNLDTF